MKRGEFTGFYEKHVGRIYKFVYFRVAGNREKAEDLTQDIFMKAFEAFERYDPKISASAWIYTIARNHIINMAAKDRPQTDIEEVEFKVANDWEHLAERSFDEKRLLEALERLPTQEADLVRMKYLEGWKYKEIAEILGRNPGALRVQMSRVLKKLKAILKQK
jgi:RNA polymerase sigma-70 factor (ECF subfamily)